MRSTKIIKFFLKISQYLLVLVALPVSLIADDSAFQVAAKMFNSCSSKQASLVVRDLQTQRNVINIAGQQPLKPASVMKVITSAALINRYSTEFKFKTKFYIYRDGNRNSLIIQGFGDPSIRDKELWEIAHNLKRHGIYNISNVIVDDSSFINHKSRQGQRAYEAGVSALTFNYNTLMIEVCPGTRNSEAFVFTEPSELGIRTEGRIMTQAGSGSRYSIDEINSGAGLPIYRLSGHVGASRSCESFYRSVGDPAYYFGQVLASYLVYLNSAEHPQVQKGRLSSFSPLKRRLVYTHQSESLIEHIRDMNLFSSNMLAEHMLMLIGAEGTESFNRDRGLNEIGNFLVSRGFKRENFVIADASGLDHAGRLTSEILVDVLAGFGTDVRFGIELRSTLPVGGRTGTLRKRYTNLRGATVRAKTGTLNGVTSLAGFLSLSNGRELAFAILQNAIRSKWEGSACEDKVITYLANNLR